VTATARGPGSRDDSMPFFVDPPIYVVWMQTEPGFVSYVVDDFFDKPKGTAVLGFLSPIDAYIEALFQVQPGIRFGVSEARHIDKRAFCARDGRLAVALHLAWVAHNGLLLQRPSGRLCGLRRSMGRKPAPAGPARFEVDEESLSELDIAHDLVGLFAWRETSHAVPRWGPERVYAMARQAALSLKTMIRPENLPTDEVQLSYFDPETEQWHFAPALHAMAAGLIQR